MCASQASVHQRTERRIIHRPDSSVAAWVLGLPDGAVLLTVNAGVLATPGAEHYIEAWCRLTLLRGRPFDLLTTATVRADAHLVAGHQYASPT